MGRGVMRRLTGLESAAVPTEKCEDLRVMQFFERVGEQFMQQSCKQLSFRVRSREIAYRLFPVAFGVEIDGER